MVSIIISLFFHVFLGLEFYPAEAETWIRAGYWDSRDGVPISSINSSLFTHLICSPAGVDSSSYQLYFTSRYVEKQFSNFTEIVRQKNPSVTTLVSIREASSVLSSMVSNSSYRKSFVDSSIRLARLHSFQGLDFSWVSLYSINDTFHMGLLFEEWRHAIELESKDSNQTQLILTARVPYLPSGSFGEYPVESIQKYMNWVHVRTAGYQPRSTTTTVAHAALFDPRSIWNTDYGVKQWIEGGLSADKLVLCLPFYGYAWKIVNAEINGIGAPAAGPAIKETGFVTYNEIKNYIQQYSRNGRVMYNSTYVVNYCSIGNIWFGFDDVEAVITKINFAKEKRLLGYFVWKITYDKDSILSQAAAEGDKQIISSPSVKHNDNNYHKNGHGKRRLLVIIISTSAIAVIPLLGISIYYFWMRKLKFKGNDLANYNQSESQLNKTAAAEDLNTNAPNLNEYTLDEIEVATNRFSIENRLGEGGYGPVYKGVLPDKQEIAVKKLSKTSTQGFEEFKNEVTLTAKLQHVNLVRVLGFCIDKEEHILIYEYMPKKSLDYYLFDPFRRLILDWRKRVHIIEGVTQGLLYLQEYSRLTIIHRDLKASNVLLDEDMKPKISDFGMARIFSKDGLEANTERLAGTRGIIPPEYIKYGTYSTKFDVYSFGILLLHIISGERSSIFYGSGKNLSLPAYAHEMWENGKGMEFVDPILDDTHSACKLMRCLQIALLCVQGNPNDRPSMLEVSSMMKNETAYINPPKRPDLSIQEEKDARNNSTLRLEMLSSKNDATISEVVARL